MKCVKTGRLEKLIKAVELFTYPVDGNCRLAPTGEPYVTFISSGIKEEGECADFHMTAVEAVNDFWENIGNYISRQSGTIYWRLRPVLCHSQYELPWDYGFDGNFNKRLRNKQYTVRCRLLCSKKPIKGE